MNILGFDKKEIQALLPMKRAIPLMEEALLSLATGSAVQPLRSVFSFGQEEKKLLGVMPAYEGINNALAVKVITVFPENKKYNLSSHQGVVILFSGATGEPLAILDADELTAIRTAAVSAVATKLLSADKPSALAILGSGTQATKHLEAISEVREITSVTVWSRSAINAEQLAEDSRSRYSFPINVASSAAEAVQGANIICTTTAATTPILDFEHVAPGAHINAVGACTPAARELGSNLISECKLFTDSKESLENESGDFLIPLAEGKIKKDHPSGTIGEVLLGQLQGRENQCDITVFKSLGLAVEDLFAARFVYTSRSRILPS